jgi:hypothetical protein
MRLDLRRLWLVSFAGFFLMIGAWAVASPYDATPDEIDHIFRATGVVSGEIMPEPTKAKRGSGAYQTAPAGLVRENCWQFDPRRSVGCATPPGDERTPVKVPSGAGRYHPVYYALVGLPLKYFPGWGGLFAARLISGGIAAALLAGAAAAILACSRRRLAMAGLLAAVTPMAAHMASGVNPNGVEIAAGVAFFAAVVPLFVGRAGDARRWLFWLAGVSALLLAMLRTTGPLWLAVAFVVFALPLSASNVRELVRQRAAWIWGGLVALAVATSALWVVVMKSTDLGDFRLGTTLTASQAGYVEAERWRGYLDQIVGVTSWLDTRMVSPAYIVWELAAGALVVAALVVGGWVVRLRLLGLIAGGTLVPSLLQVKYANETGFITQGRYMLPMLVGVVIYAAYVLDERLSDVQVARSANRLFAVALLPIHLLCLLVTMVRWQNGFANQPGITSFDPFAGEWHPVVGSATPLLMMTAGLLVVGWLAWTAADRPGWGSATGAGTGEGAVPGRRRPGERPAEMALQSS